MKPYSHDPRNDRLVRRVLKPILAKPLTDVERGMAFWYASGFVNAGRPVPKAKNKVRAILRNR